MVWGFWNVFPLGNGGRDYCSSGTLDINLLIVLAIHVANLGFILFSIYITFHLREVMYRTQRFSFL